MYDPQPLHTDPLPDTFTQITLQRSSEATTDIRSLHERVEELEMENSLLSGGDGERMGMIKELEESVLHMDEVSVCVYVCMYMYMCV